MNKLKRFIAAILACAALFAMTACGKSTSVALTVNGTEIPAGVYIYFLSEATTDAYSKFQEAAPETVSDFWSFSIDNTAVKTWIENKAIESCKLYVANTVLAEEYNAKLTDSQKKQINSSVDSNWENYSTTIEKMGISKDSYTKIFQNTYIENNVFNAIYGVDGKTPVPDNDLKDYMVEILSRVKSIQFSLKNSDGKALSVEEKEKLIKKAQNYASRINHGESFDVIYDEYLETKSDIEGADPYRNEKWVWVESTTPSEEYVKMIFATSDDGKAITFEDGDYYYLVQRLDASERTDYFEENRDALLRDIKGDEFDEFLEKACENYEVVRNEKAIKRYDAEKMGFIDTSSSTASAQQ